MINIDWMAFVLLMVLLGVIALYIYRHPQKKKQSAFLFPSFSDLKNRSRTFRERSAFLPIALWIVSFILFLIALLDPHTSKEFKPQDAPPEEGMAIYLLLDRSGSMNEVLEPPLSKFAILKRVTNQFIDQAHDDLIGVVTFARYPVVISPLTVDHKDLKERVNQLTVVKDPKKDGTAIGYAIYKTAHLISSMQEYQNFLHSAASGTYDIKNAVMILITDGFQDPSYLDRGNRLRTMEMQQAAEYAKEKKIRLYIVNIDPSINQEKYAPNRHELEKAAKLTGGEFIVTDKASDLGEVLTKINKLEKSRISAELPEIMTVKVPYYPYFISLGLALLGLGLFFQETFWRRVL